MADSTQKPYSALLVGPESVRDINGPEVVLVVPVRSARHATDALTILTTCKRVGISANSDKGQLVLEPFCGCGTAVLAAEMEGRR
jgi:hypothetical protein